MKNTLKGKNMRNVVLFASVVWMLSFNLAYSATITMTTGEFCPYVCKSETGKKYTGFWIDVLTEIFSNKGYEVRFIIVPWERAFSAFNGKQNVDGIIGVFDWLPVRKDIVFYPNVEICQYSHAFYALKESNLKEKWEWDRKRIELLKNLKLGVVAGYMYGNAELDEYISNMSDGKTVQPLKGSHEVVKRNFLKLMDKRFDVWLADYPMAEHFFIEQRKQSNPEVLKVERLSVLPEVINAYAAFYNDETGKHYAAIFDEGMQQLSIVDPEFETVD
ncbi:MAG: transporter substrate-binding domain-containing protein [Gallionellaceae bacterium]